MSRAACKKKCYSSVVLNQYSIDIVNLLLILPNHPFILHSVHCIQSNTTLGLLNLHDLQHELTSRQYHNYLWLGDYESLSSSSFWVGQMALLSPC